MPSKLTDELDAMGFHIEGRGGKKQEIAGVAQSAIDTFRKRTDRVAAAATKLGIRNAALKAELGAKTRSKKQKELTPDELCVALDSQLDRERAALASEELSGRKRCSKVTDG